MMVKKYTVPNTIITKILTNNIMNIFGASSQKNLTSATLCPFDALWCSQKQNHLNELRDMVKYVAPKGANYVSYTCGDMFDGCPFHYQKLCSLHGQKQRG